MQRAARGVWSAAAIAAAVLIAGSPASAGQGCAARRMTIVGPFCMDRYEASVWRIPHSATELIQKAQTGKPTAAELIAGGATQLGVGAADDYGPCHLDGSNCADIYAVSTAGVRPSANINWFQAQQACANARKRLSRNAEWQAAVAGAPDPGPDDRATDCNTSRLVVGPVENGSRSACVSSFGNYDMVENLYEWMADWTPASQSACPDWDAFSNDSMCFAGADTLNLGPGALLRGGFYFSGESAGPLDVVGSVEGTFESENIGFRCAR